jgi:hypothetical protein
MDMLQAQRVALGAVFIAGVQAIIDLDQAA